MPSVDAGPRTALLVPGDADVVHSLPAGQTICAATSAGQYYAGNRLYTRTTQEEIALQYAAPQWCGYTVRDAATGEPLFRSDAARKPPATIKTGRGRFICLSGPGYPIWDRRSLSGVAPCFSAPRDGGFDPSAR